MQKLAEKAEGLAAVMVWTEKMVYLEKGEKEIQKDFQTQAAEVAVPMETAEMEQAQIPMPQMALMVAAEAAATRRKREETAEMVS